MKLDISKRIAVLTACYVVLAEKRRVTRISGSVIYEPLPAWRLASRLDMVFLELFDKNKYKGVRGFEEEV
ncbi:MAG: hypothetical protein NZ954_07315 [Thermofilaceae archaeon]|nr:hypothetical protein [Thermofilaceae archaeon]MCX8180593.1 hypothetical protein [Thermofilaceae archaeon]MDW8003695.1 hypothetical protein [Thermofilaceae archaeon]